MRTILGHLLGGDDSLVAGDLQKSSWGNLEANLRFLARTRLLDAPPVDVLEIGCGKGGLLEHVEGYGHRTVGVDVDPEVLIEARTERVRPTMVAASGASLPFRDQRFDVIVSFDVFEHIADSDAHLREVRRVLRPGGAYLLQTPNKWTNLVFEPIRFTRKFGIRHAFRFLEDHCALHSYWQLRRRLRANDFEVRYFDIPVVNDFFRAKLRRFLGPPGVWLLSVVNPDRLPLPLRTNFYVLARRN